MEMSRGKRIAIIILLVASIALSFLAGYFFRPVKPSYNTSGATSEVVSILDNYYYKDYDKDEFLVSSLEGGLKSLNDPYTYLYTQESENQTNYKGFGFGVSLCEIGLKIGSIVEDSPAYKAGLANNDIIIEVNEKEFAKLGKDPLLDEFRSNDTVDIVVLRDYKKFNVSLTKDNITNQLVKSKKIDTIGYIKIEQFSDGVANLFKSELEKLESQNISGLIIDVRNNPGGSVGEVVGILRCFLTGNTPFLYLKETKGTTDIYKPNNDTEKKPYDIKVLIDKNSASASEVFALAMNKIMDYDLIGVNTYGKNVFQSDFKIKNLENTYLHITLGYWEGPNNERITSEGVAPTIEIANDYHNPMPLDNTTYSIDMASDEIKNIELMLKTIGYDVRVDGYFDSNLETILSTNYSSEVLNITTKEKILNDYMTYVKNNDLVLNKALDLLK